MSPDPQQMVATVAASSPDADALERYVGQVVFFDTFSDGRKITLNVEALVVPRPENRQTGFILLVSPDARESPIWSNLRDLGRKAARKARGPA